VGFNLAAPFNRKIRKGIQGRRRLFQQLEQQVRSEDLNAEWFWIHSSSMGEFEQAKPIISALKEHNNRARFLATFFSPSGFEHARGFKDADVFSYIPFDTRRNARRFLNIVRPKVAIFMRYDLWLNHVLELSRRGIPAYVASATMNSQRNRSWLQRSFLNTLYSTTKICTVSMEDAKRFESIGVGPRRLTIMGDTRFDRVWQMKEIARRRTLIPPQIIQDRLVFVVGSSWQEDEGTIIPAVLMVREKFPNMLTILVPHEPTESNLERLETQINAHFSHRRFSEISLYSGEEVILVDSVGILLALYSYATAAFVGGSFKGGVHNVLEPASFGVPILVGPKIMNSQEALELVKHGGAFIVHSAIELAAKLEQLFADAVFRQEIGSAAARFVQMRTGATQRFLEVLMKGGTL